jgi:hypothetical protein
MAVAVLDCKLFLQKVFAPERKATAPCLDWDKSGKAAGAMGRRLLGAP